MAGWVWEVRGKEETVRGCSQVYGLGSREMKWNLLSDKSGSGKELGKGTEQDECFSFAKSGCDSARHSRKNTNGLLGM